jgi:hypothetical protein
VATILEKRETLHEKHGLGNLTGIGNQEKVIKVFSKHKRTFAMRWRCRVVQR